MKISLITMRIYKIFSFLLLLVFAVVAIMTAVSALDLPWGFRMYVISSGSMAPTLPVGSLVFVRPAADYQVGDIVNFQVTDPESHKKVFITHRITGLDTAGLEAVYQTKGDANNVADFLPLQRSQITGKVAGMVPYVGFPVTLARTQFGFTFLVVVPATIIIYQELVNLKSIVAQYISSKRKPELVARRIRRAKYA